jgi:glycosyltransferase involved in cell wall biosynthesis
MSASRERLSVVIITRNEHRNLPTCLESVSFAGEVLVMDSFSSDGTPEVAKAFGARVIQRSWDGYVPQRQFGFDQARGEWILWLDADERVTPELGSEIRRVIGQPDGPDAYRIPRRHYFLGDWLRYGGQYPGYQIRLVRKPKAQLRGTLVHESIDETNLELATLDGAIDHFSTPTLRSRWQKLHRYARLTVEESRRRGGLWSIPIMRSLLFPLRRIAYVYLRQHGYRDGWRGLLWALMCGCEQALIFVYALPYRLSGQGPATSDSSKSR